jgi:hypothetical protein
MLIAQHLPDDLRDRHPVYPDHRRPSFVEALRTPTMMSAAVAGTTFRPTRSYTTLWNATNSSQPPSADPASAPRRGKDRSGASRAPSPAMRGKGRPLLPAWAVDEVVEH